MASLPQAFPMAPLGEIVAGSEKQNAVAPTPTHWQVLCHKRQAEPPSQALQEMYPRHHPAEKGVLSSPECATPQRALHCCRCCPSVSAATAVAVTLPVQHQCQSQGSGSNPTRPGRQVPR